MSPVVTLNRRSTLTVIVALIALLLCAIFMPDMAMAALICCAVAVLVVSMRGEAPELARTHVPASRPWTAHRSRPRITGPPIAVPLRT